MRILKVSMILALVSLVVHGPSYGEYNFYFGRDLFFRDPSGGNIFYAIYDYNRADEDVTNDKKYLQDKIYILEGKSYKITDLELIRTLKAINYDIYIHQYACKQYSHKYYYLAHSFENGMRMVLNEFSINEFNEFFSNFEKLSDYIYISKLYLIFKCPENRVDFVESYADIEYVYALTHIPLPSFNKTGTEISSMIEKPSISDLNEGKEIRIYVYNVGESRIYQYLFTFVNMKLLAVAEKMIVDLVNDD